MTRENQLKVIEMLIANDEIAVAKFCCQKWFFIYEEVCEELDKKALRRIKKAF